jgi:hypothetical protein
MEVNQFSTLSNVLNAFRDKGYTEDFLIDEHGMRGYGRQETIAPEDVTIERRG